ncbi:hypothetical protein PS9374_02680 [Planomonospora sphaerica]|uniref:Uncharacterized protein n=1 Tax=Planomonospora sphaerica TaxID=161355 RepID=A0A171CPL5_9ACTN|nr:hypothetical protein [Planomonospora sphaerica]GAT67027.1 hypothetical protein PS9374_02680 [Planomonospora sphaerica]
MTSAPSPASAPPAVPPRTTGLVIVDNAGDDLAATRHLNALGHLADGRAIVRPTPGASDLPTLGLDVLVALGKHPHAARNERVTDGWTISRAWLEGAGVTDVIVDRAHLLTAEQAAALAALAAEAEATLWLLWSDSDPLQTPAVHQAQQALQAPAEVIDLWEFHQRLPAPARPPLAAGPGQESVWPPLPAADFTTFLAACRRRLARADFAQVHAIYHDAADATDDWLEAITLTGQRTAPPIGAITGWLRDHTVGCAPTPQTALIRLRAVQAALFVHGILLRWQADALGADPARRLLGDLTPHIAARLHRICRTDAAAATTLALHLNHRCRDFDLLRLADVAPDGSAIRTPALEPGGLWAASYPRYPGDKIKHPRHIDDVTWAEFAFTEPIRIPEHARPIFAAHRAWRRQCGASETDPYFVHRKEPKRRPPAAMLNSLVKRTCATLGLDPFWMHGRNCIYGTDIGVTHRTIGWTVERGLTVHPLAPVRDIGLPRPRQPRGERTRWARRPIA